MLDIFIKTKKKRRCWLIILLSLLLFIFLIWYLYYKQEKLEVIFFDIGQGDSALIKTPHGQIILIDGGPDDRLLRRLGESLPFYRRQIDLIILSHYHDDHATGLVSVINRYQVNKIIYASGTPSSLILEELLKTAKDQKVALLALTSIASLDLRDGCTLNIWDPLSLDIKPDDNNSLVARLKCREQTFLFSGDNNSTVEKALIKSGWNLQANIFKASHHGSNSANSEEFLKLVNPRLVVISVGKDNKFGHPNAEVLERITNLGIRSKRTDMQGNIRIISP